MAKDSEIKDKERSSQMLWQHGDDNQRLLTFSYFAFGAITWFVLGKMFQYFLNLVFSNFFLDSSLALSFERLSEKIEPGFILGFFVVLGLGLWARFKPEINHFGLETIVELKKVTWPPMNVTSKSTVAVIITVILFGILLGTFDLVWGYLSGLVLG